LAKRTALAEIVVGLRSLSTEIDRLDQAAANRYGLNRTDMRALDIVGSAGPLTPTDLAARLGFTTGGITPVIDRLERSGYLRRRPDTVDRRRLMLEITDITEARDREVFAGLIRQTTSMLNAYGDEELLLIRDFLERARALTASYADALAEPTQTGPVQSGPERRASRNRGRSEPMSSS